MTTVDLQAGDEAPVFLALWRALMVGEGRHPENAINAGSGRIDQDQFDVVELHLVEAILSVAADAAQAGYRAVGVGTDDLVAAPVTAQRTGRTRESVRLLPTGRRGPGGFPAPVVAGRWTTWSWQAVRGCFAGHGGAAVVGPAERGAATLAAADLLLRARALSPDSGRLAALAIRPAGPADGRPPDRTPADRPSLAELAR
ncbi:MAG: hypothetical protein LBH76_08710 [Propionibacteriaceae bacterium]|jgi:hypothetical protein|nr:hypothetical protein [Propionibacteriaceae bacterium]